MKLTKEDKQLLHQISRNKGYELGARLIEHGVERADFDYIMQGSNEVKYENNNQRLLWLGSAMERMIQRLGEEKTKKIRMASACCLGGQRAEETKRIRDSFPTVQQRFEELAKCRLIIGHTATKLDDGSYRICFWEHPEGNKGCSCLKHIPKEKPMPMAWCWCCAGHIKTHFENALGVKAECEIISSQLTSCGAKPCAFKLTVKEIL